MTSALTLDEIMWVIIKNKREEVLRETIEDISSKTTRDAFHVAVMKYLGLIEIASDDVDFDRVKGIRRMEL